LFVLFYLGWPWPSQDHVFPGTKTRFALQNGVETYPPTSTGAGTDNEDSNNCVDFSTLSIKELKVAISRANLQDQTQGFSEKREFVELLTTNANKNAN
jgi:hypothetical protein